MVFAGSRNLGRDSSRAASSSKENAEVHIGRIERNLPPDGEVRVLTVTDKQFERMRIFWGKTRSPPEKPLCQLQLF